MWMFNTVKVQAGARDLPHIGRFERWWRRVCTRMLDGKGDPGMPVIAPLVYKRASEPSAADRSRAMRSD